MTFALQLVSRCLPAYYKQLLLAYFVAAGVGERLQGTEELFLYYQILDDKVYWVMAEMSLFETGLTPLEFWGI